MTEHALATLRELLAGNERFRTGNSLHHQYPPDLIERLGKGQKPIAAIVACSDGRVAPEVVFDQPLANLFVSRVPGNVASDSAKWMLEIAVTNMNVPLVMVMGHTRCLAIGQVVEGQPGAGGSLRSDVARAVQTARLKDPEDLYRQSIVENALQTTSELKYHSIATRRALDEGRISIVTSVYDVDSGLVEVLDVPQEALASLR